MRLSELFARTLSEDELSSIETQIINLLSVLSAEGITTVDTAQLVNDLQDLGYFVDSDTIVDILDGIQMVASANADTIDISSPNAGMASNDDTAMKGQNKIKRDAQSQADEPEIDAKVDIKDPSSQLDVDTSKKQDGQVDKTAKQQARKDI